MSPRGRERRPPAPPRPRPRKKARKLGRFGCLAIAFFVLLLAGTLYVGLIAREITRSFEGSLWAVPSRVYSAPLTVSLGQPSAGTRIRSHLDLGRYARVVFPPQSPGQYRVAGENIDVYLREMRLPGRTWPRRRMRFEIRMGRLVSIQEGPPGRFLQSAELEPQAVSSFYGASREERTVLPLSAYPKVLIDAVLAAEDQRFYRHHGLDPFGILRALFENLRSGSVVQGGSTITQQTVKNLYLNVERSVGRKLREAIMALVLDAKYPKDRILEVYMNEVYLGQRGGAEVCGFGEAARFYFGKTPDDLDLAESAMLAGIIRAPAVYNPLTHPDRALARKDVVIQQMLEQGWITREQAKRGAATRPSLARGTTAAFGGRYFMDEVRRELERSHAAPDLEGGGLVILSTIDTWLQARAEDALEDGLERLEKSIPALQRRARRGQPLEGCLIALRPRTGEIAALVGGRSYADSQFDRATQAMRQPGSLFKPFVYATGFESGRTEDGRLFTPATILADEPLTMEVSGKEWSPHNYDEDYRGNVTARQALEGSLNVPTVRAAIAIGLDRIARTAEAAGMGRDLKPYPSIALGAQEVTPLDAAAAFATFADGGLRPRPYSVALVGDASGRLLERARPELTRIFSPQAAYLTLDLMRGVVERGTAASLREHGLAGDFAGKTGTTNDKRDAWFIGFSPDILVLVWVGYDDMSEIHLTGAQGAVPIWESFMRAAGEFENRAVFPRPDGIVEARIDPTTGGLATGRCPEEVDEIFIEGQVPAECEEHAGGGIRRFWRRLFGHREEPPAKPAPRPNIE
jgi:penicillin-binding protein 1B